MENKPNMSASFAVQNQIRENAQEMQSYLVDLKTWEKTIKSKEKALKQSSTVAKAKPSVRSSKVRFQVKSSPNTVSSTHPLDSPRGTRQVQPIRGSIDSEVTTVAPKSREDMEKEDGNTFYKKGDFSSAVKCYTRSLAYNPNNVVVLSNRAMAYIKLNQYSKARDDCSLALKMDDTHVKSWSRRATALNALGQHRAALADFVKASELEPTNKQLKVEIRKTREHMKAAIKRAPRKPLVIEYSMQIMNNESEVESKIEESAVQCDGLEGKAQDTTEKNTNTRTMATPIRILPKIPSKPPKTSYEFCSVWKSITYNSDDKLDLQYKYLMLIDPVLLPKIFKNSMELDLFLDIAQVVDQRILPENIEKGFLILESLSKVPRFDMTRMFLSNANKQTLKTIFEKLEMSLSSAQNQIKSFSAVTVEQVGKLRQLYDV